MVRSQDNSNIINNWEKISLYKRNSALWKMVMNIQINKLTSHNYNLTIFHKISNKRLLFLMKQPNKLINHNPNIPQHITIKQLNAISFFELINIQIYRVPKKMTL
jgi:hypothetical protein